MTNQETYLATKAQDQRAESEGSRIILFGSGNPVCGPVLSIPIGGELVLRTRLKSELWYLQHRHWVGCDFEKARMTFTAPGNIHSLTVHSLAQPAHCCEQESSGLLAAPRGREALPRTPAQCCTPSLAVGAHAALSSPMIYWWTTADLN